MLKLTPAIRLSIGLVFLTISLLIVAHGLGFTPDQSKVKIKNRQQLGESIALQTTLALKRNDRSVVESYLAQAVAQHDIINSIALRNSNGSIQYETGGHGQFWGDWQSAKSTPTHLQVPILVNGVKHSTLQISYVSLADESAYWFGISHFFWLIAFICCFGFVAFWFYIKRVLKHLDPSSVVPARVRNALDIMAEGVLIMDKRGQVVLANQSICSSLSISESKVLGKHIGGLGWVDKESGSTELPWDKALRAGEQEVGACLVNTIFGKDITFSVRAVPIFAGGGRSIGVIASFDDVTELEEKNRLLEQMVADLKENKKSLQDMDKKLKFLASRDPLTNCYNRRSMLSRLDGFFEQSNNPGHHFSLVLIDVDNLKHVNDRYGQAVGDDVLRGVAEMITLSVRPGDILARFEGEEFCLLLPKTTINEAQHLAEKCRQRIESDHIAGVSVSVSLGLASSEMSAQSANGLINKADTALFESKLLGGNTVTGWDTSLETDISNVVQKAVGA